MPQVCQPPTETEDQSVIDATWAGDFFRVLLPMPSSPRSLLPQQNIAPVVFTAHVCSQPAETEAHPVPFTSCGVQRWVASPIPSWPRVFMPQQNSSVVSLMPQVVAPLVLMDDHSAPPTCTGVTLSLLVPMPSWPQTFSPKHQAVASARTSQLVIPPAATCGVTGVVGGGSVGTPVGGRRRGRRPCGRHVDECVGRAVSPQVPRAEDQRQGQQEYGDRGEDPGRFHSQMVTVWLV